MGVSRPTNDSSKNSDLTFVEFEIPTSEGDNRRLRELREAPVGQLLERINEFFPWQSHASDISTPGEILPTSAEAEQINSPAGTAAAGTWSEAQPH